MNPKPPSEPDAMSAMESALAPLEADARARVLGWAASKFSVTATVPTAAPSTATSPQPTPGHIKSFIAQKRPSNKYELMACLVYYLEKFDQKSEINLVAIRQANTDARQPNLSNASVFVKHATSSYGYLARVSKGNYAVSAKGEAVVEALPDQTRVKALLAEARTRPSKKKASLKK